jgi:hypothetical protein
MAISLPRKVTGAKEFLRDKEKLFSHKKFKPNTVTFEDFVTFYTGFKNSFSTLYDS